VQILLEQHIGSITLSHRQKAYKGRVGFESLMRIDARYEMRSDQQIKRICVHAAVERQLGYNQKGCGVGAPLN
jgi:hypothetical protein